MAGIITSVGLQELDFGSTYGGISYKWCEFVDVGHEKKGFSFRQLKGILIVTLSG